MKSNILVAILVTLTAANVRCDELQDIQQISRSCLAEARVTEAELQAFYMNGMNESDAKDNVKCHMKCVMEKKGNLKNGVFDEEATIKSMKQIPQLKDHQDQMQGAVRECKNERGINDCDTAFKITMCFKEFKASLKS